MLLASWTISHASVLALPTGEAFTAASVLAARAEAAEEPAPDISLALRSWTGTCGADLERCGSVTAVAC